MAGVDHRTGIDPQHPPLEASGVRVEASLGGQPRRRHQRPAGRRPAAHQQAAGAAIGCLDAAGNPRGRGGELAPLRPGRAAGGPPRRAGDAGRRAGRRARRAAGRLAGHRRAGRAALAAPPAGRRSGVWPLSCPGGVVGGLKVSSSVFICSRFLSSCCLGLASAGRSTRACRPGKRVGGPRHVQSDAAVGPLQPDDPGVPDRHARKRLPASSWPGTRLVVSACHCTVAPSGPATCQCEPPSAPCGPALIMKRGRFS